MAKRECIECGGELVMTFRPHGGGQGSTTVPDSSRSNASWRCSTCGHSFSAGQLRDDKRAQAKAVGQA